VTLTASTISDIAGNILDGEAPAAGSGRGCIYDSSIDLPSGDGVPGGDSVFYVASFRGDITGDFFVSQADLDTMLTHWGWHVAAGDVLSGDLTGDGFVGMDDLSVLLGNLGKRLPFDPRLLGDLDGNGFVGQGDLDMILAKWGQQVANGDPADPTGDLFVGQGDLDLVLANWGHGDRTSAGLIQTQVTTMLQSSCPTGDALALRLEAVLAEGPVGNTDQQPPASSTASAGLVDLGSASMSANTKKAAGLIGSFPATPLSPTGGSPGRRLEIQAKLRRLGTPRWLNLLGNGQDLTDFLCLLRLPGSALP
jgi:hypothetical protein